MLVCGIVRAKLTYRLDEPVKDKVGVLVDVLLDPIGSLVVANSVLGQSTEQVTVLLVRVRTSLGLVGVNDLELLKRVLATLDLLSNESRLNLGQLALGLSVFDTLRVLLVIFKKGEKSAL